MVGNRTAVALSAGALVVSLLGSTTAGRAALDAVVPVPLAKRAYLADTAKNANKLNNIKASTTPTPGMLVPLDSNGKLPASVGAVGLQGQAGSKGDKGEKGKDGTKNIVIRASQPTVLGPGAYMTDGVSCAKDERAVGGYEGGVDGSFNVNLVTSGKPAMTDHNGNIVVATPGSTPTGWMGLIQRLNTGVLGQSTVAIYAICVSS